MTEVHVFQLALDDAPASEAERALLSAAERERAARFRLDRDRERYVRAHAFLRTVLARYAGGAPAELPLATLADGKPILGGSDVHFSLSHCRTFALIAVGRAEPLGVDVEDVRAEPLEESLLQATLCPAELEAWRQLDAEARPRAFYRAWTRKEAVLKARGEGLGTAPNQVDVRGAEALGWTLVDLPLQGHAVAALALARPARVRRF